MFNEKEVLSGLQEQKQRTEGLFKEAVTLGNKLSVEEQGYAKQLCAYLKTQVNADEYSLPVLRSLEGEVYPMWITRNIDDCSTVSYIVNNGAVWSIDVASGKVELVEWDEY